MGEPLVSYYGLNPTQVHRIVQPLPALLGLDSPGTGGSRAGSDLADGRVLVAACYTLPFTLPDFQALLPKQSLVDRMQSIRNVENALAMAREQSAQARMFAAKERGRLQDLLLLKKMYLDLKGSSRQLKSQALEVMAEEGLALAARAFCANDAHGQLVITAQAVVRIEPREKAL